MLTSPESLSNGVLPAVEISLLRSIDRVAEVLRLLLLVYGSYQTLICFFALRGNTAR